MSSYKLMNIEILKMYSQTALLFTFPVPSSFSGISYPAAFLKLISPWNSSGLEM